MSAPTRSHATIRVSPHDRQIANEVGVASPVLAWLRAAKKRYDRCYAVEP
jgi:hypothetical protein